MSMRTILGAFNSESVAVSTSAVELKGVATTRPLSPRLALTVQATGTDIFVGGPNVTTANGLKIAAGAQLSVNAADGLWVVAAAGTTAGILEGF